MSSYRMKYKIGATQYHIPVVDDMAGFGGGVPLGTILPYSMSSQYPPEGFLFCDGSAVSRAMYPDLFNLIGTTYGIGDGSTTFNLPDLGFISADKATVFGKEDTALKLHYPICTTTSTSGSIHTLIAGTGSGLIQNQATGYSGMNIVTKSDGVDSAVYADLSSVVSNVVCYVIKAFSSYTADSAMVDMTECANELNKKMDLKVDSTILYPNNGTEQNPANVSVGGRYVLSNPFPGYRVGCQAEVYCLGQWGVTVYTATNSGAGVFAFQHNDDNIVVCTGSYRILADCSSGYRAEYPNTFQTTNTYYTSAPCRVKVWKIGKIPQSS